ncbi:MAG: aminotransferase class I/II-fold pyridoxal phosphate-dependent enzyme [Spirochaetales bacterium]|nr:aminotransferase class I/II-fold pyridoxal phosphate-dependent enzyme [Spirochaetales bacterium]
MRDFALEAYFSQWEFTAKHHMTASDAQSMSIQELLNLAGEGAQEELEQCWLGYTPTWGDEELRDLIAQNYERIQSSQVLCFAGAEEGLYVAMRTLLQPGDHMVVFTPNYQAAESVPEDIGVTITGVDLRPENDWCPQPQELKAAITANTRLVSVNFPNNPTGSIPSQELWMDIIEICRHHNLYLFSDEVYRGLELHPHHRLPQATDVYEKALSLNVLSKSYGFPGLRLGWIACQEAKLLGEMERYKHYLSICNPSPTETLGKMVLRHGSKIWEKNRQLIASNLDILDDFFAHYPHLFEWKRPQGGCVAFPRYLGAEGAQTFCQKLVQEQGVLLLPPSVYDTSYGPSHPQHFRIGFGRKNIQEGLEAMKGGLSV